MEELQETRVKKRHQLKPRGPLGYDLVPIHMIRYNAKKLIHELQTNV